MTPARLAECLTLLRWSRRSLADATGYDESTVRLWLSGRYPTPPLIARWIERAATFHAKHPAPRKGNA